MLTGPLKPDRISLSVTSMQLAADMGGAGYIFTGEHDADVMHNSATINLNVLNAAHSRNNRQAFYFIAFPLVGFNICLP
jgi:hypothetical protein